MHSLCCSRASNCCVLQEARVNGGVLCGRVRGWFSAASHGETHDGWRLRDWHIPRKVPGNSRQARCNTTSPCSLTHNSIL